MSAGDVAPPAEDVAQRAGELSAVRTESEQPTAPYLDAVVAYGFRGPGRFHVPGHKGGPGADPGLRKAIGADALAADVPQDIPGIDVGPSPTPFERAERLAAEAHGADRTFFLTNGATQGNHALCLALAPLGARVVAQRNSHASIVDGLVLSGGLPTFVAPEYDDELGMAHGVTPAALAEALDETRRAAGGVRRLADLLRDGRRRRRPGRGRPRRGRAARRRPGLGPALRLPRGAAAQRAGAGRRRGAGQHAQDRRLADPERHAARGAPARASTWPRSAARCGCCARRARRRC